MIQFLQGSERHSAPLRHLRLRVQDGRRARHVDPVFHLLGSSELQPGRQDSGVERKGELRRVPRGIQERYLREEGQTAADAGSCQLLSRAQLLVELTTDSNVAAGPFCCMCACRKQSRSSSRTRCSADDKQSEPLRCRPQVDAAGGACPRRLFLAFTFLFFSASIALHSSHFNIAEFSHSHRSRSRAGHVRCLQLVQRERAAAERCEEKCRNAKLYETSTTQ